MIPLLFIAGVAFGYFLVLPAAAKFLLNFNDSQFNVQVQAKQYYGFFAMTLLACGDRLPGPGRDPLGHPPGDRQGRAADQEPALRLPRLRGRRGGAARRRPDLDAARDGPAGRPLRALDRAREGVRDARRDSSTPRLRAPERVPRPRPRLRQGRGRRSGGSASPGRRRRSSSPGRSRLTTELAPITHALPHRHPAGHRAVDAEPAVGADLDRALRGEALPGDRQLGVVEAVLGIADEAAVGEHHVVADRHPFLRGDHRAPVEEAARADLDLRRRRRGSASSRARAASLRRSADGPRRAPRGSRPRPDSGRRSRRGRRGDRSAAGARAGGCARTSAASPTRCASRSAPSPHRTT